MPELPRPSRRPVVAMVLEWPLRRLLAPLLDRLTETADRFAAEIDEAVAEAEEIYSTENGQALHAELEHPARRAGQAHALAELADHPGVAQQVHGGVDVDLVAGGLPDDVEVDELRVVVADELEGDPLVVGQVEGHRTHVRTEVKP